MLVRELAEKLPVILEGDGDIEIVSAAPLESAGAGDLSFVSSGKAFSIADISGAGCLVVPKDYENEQRRTVLRAEHPRGIFAAALALLYPAAPVQPGIHATAEVHPDANIDSSAEVGAHVSIGARARIGAGCRIGPGCAIGADASIGANSTLHANVTLYSGARVGARCILHSGCVIGADGFGFVLAGSEYQKFPQVGQVEIGDDVEIGANSCIDRAALGITIIGDGTKLDNMVHIGHNCRIGRHVVIAAQTGLSGGVVVEDYAVIGGQVGIGDKARIESRAVLGSGCGVLTSKIVRGGQVVWGTPARPLKQHLQQLANVSRVPDLRKEVEDLRKRLTEFEQRTPR
jgi:UDP-3-O-[3-hydroxymyristoyl] glucosamine N-acyltransferase